jgi:hypothetical protein
MLTTFTLIAATSLVVFGISRALNIRNNRLKHGITVKETKERERSVVDESQALARGIENKMEYLREGHRREKNSIVLDIDRILQRIETARTTLQTNRRALTTQADKYVDMGSVAKKPDGSLEPKRLHVLTASQAALVREGVESHNKGMAEITGALKGLDGPEASLKALKGEIATQLQRSEKNDPTQGLSKNPLRDSFEAAVNKQEGLSKVVKSRNLPDDGIHSTAGREYFSHLAKTHRRPGRPTTKKGRA